MEENERHNDGAKSYPMRIVNILSDARGPYRDIVRRYKFPTNDSNLRKFIALTIAGKWQFEQWIIAVQEVMKERHIEKEVRDKLKALGLLPGGEV